MKTSAFAARCSGFNAALPTTRRRRHFKVAAQGERQRAPAAPQQREVAATVAPAGQQTRVLSFQLLGKAIALPREENEALQPGPGFPREAGVLAGAGAWWDALPSRYKVLVGGFMSFVICNMVSLFNRDPRQGLVLAGSVIWHEVSTASYFFACMG